MAFVPARRATIEGTPDRYRRNSPRPSKDCLEEPFAAGRTRVLRTSTHQHSKDGAAKIKKNVRAVRSRCALGRLRSQRVSVM